MNGPFLVEKKVHVPSRDGRITTRRLVLLTASVSTEELRVYQTDAYGRVQHNKPSYAVRKDGRVVQTDGYGNRRYDKAQYKVECGCVRNASRVDHAAY